VKKSLLFLILFAIPLLSAAQSAKISGVVVSNEGEPVFAANVLLKGTAISVASDKNGKFLFNNLAAGTYTVAVRSLGYKHSEQQVTLTADQTVTTTVVLQEQTIEAIETVVTATRSERDIEDVPVSVSVISGKQIQQQGTIRLDEVLQEQTGLAIVSNQYGTGIQLQGLDPAYTMILIDGEPIIGRTAGTLELTRFTVGNIDHIEIVKGPSSSLYGSEALGGVINILTKQPQEPFLATINTRFGTFNSLDLNALVETKQEKFSASLFLNRNSSDGFSLTPEVIGTKTPDFFNYTINPKFSYKFSDATSLLLFGRLLTEKQSGIDTISGSSDRLNTRANLLDWNTEATLTHRFNPTLKLQAKMYVSRYRNDFEYLYQKNDSNYFSSNFDQYLYKPEVQADVLISNTNFLTLGSGVNFESVASDRIDGGSQSLRTLYAFAQDDWALFGKLNLNVGFRFDDNSDYGSQLSPRVAAQAKVLPWLTVRGSVGSGFKAPTFEQLYLDFTNAEVGYSVLGSSNLKDSFQRLSQSGQIQEILIDPNSLQKIRAESSVAFNAGLDVSPIEQLALKLNLFRNNIKDLIEAEPVAIKTNGQDVFSYFNLNRVYTQGVEAELALKLPAGFHVSAGYQFLQAIDQDVLDEIRAGKIGYNVGTVLNPIFVPTTESQYGGLWGRSKHTLTLKLFYENASLGLDGSIRGVLRSRYGFQDMNGNGILDADNEYAPGYAIWNAAVSKKLFTRFTLQTGIDNAFNYIDAVHTPFIAGRRFYAGLTFNY
jgi:outer membrane receptor for ferrienterochelin and colicins